MMNGLFFKTREQIVLWLVKRGFRQDDNGVWWGKYDNAGCRAYVSERTRGGFWLTLGA